MENLPFNLILYSKKLILILFICIFLFLINTVYSAVCVFRFPDRDVFKLFPMATNYLSETKKIDKETKSKIEKFLGQSLDPDETELTFFKILKGEDVIGMIHPHAERGEYGTIEVVWAFTLDGKIIDFIIQRSRERKTKELSSEEFRKQFGGKSLKDEFTIDSSKKTNDKLITPIKDAQKASDAMAYGAKKTLAFYKFLYGKE